LPLDTISRHFSAEAVERAEEEKSTLGTRYSALATTNCQYPRAYAIIDIYLPSGKIARKDQENFVLMIRLARVGARKQPHYRVVVIEKERARNGRSLEIVGTYNPRTTPASIDLKRERIAHWVSKGALLSETVSKLMAKQQPAAQPTA
jgi:small subunit ribosomal protein S16